MSSPLARTGRESADASPTAAAIIGTLRNVRRALAIDSLYLRSAVKAGAKPMNSSSLSERSSAGGISLVRQDSGSDPWRRECPPWRSGNRKLSNLLKDHSPPRRRASRKSSKRVHDGEPVFNSRTYCYPADCTMQSRSFISGFDPFFFDPTWTRTLTGLSTDQHPQTHSSCVTVGSTQLRIEGWRH